MSFRFADEPKKKSTFRFADEPVVAKDEAELPVSQPQYTDLPADDPFASSQFAANVEMPKSAPTAMESHKEDFLSAAEAVPQIPGELAKSFVSTYMGTMRGIGAGIRYLGELSDQIESKRKTDVDRDYYYLTDEEKQQMKKTPSPYVEPVVDLTRIAKMHGQTVMEYYDPKQIPWLKPDVGDFREIKSFGDVLKYAAGGVGNLAASVSFTSIMPGALGPVKVGGVAVKEATKAGVKGMIGKAAKFLTPNRMDVPIGVMEFGQILENQLEAHDEKGMDLSPWRAVITGIPATIVERGLGVEAMAAKMLKMGPEASKFAKKRLIPRILQGAGVTGLEEGAEEFVQQYLETIGGDPSLFTSKETFYQALNGALQGMIGGKVLGGAGGATAAKHYKQTQETQREQQEALIHPIDPKQDLKDTKKAVQMRAGVAEGIYQMVNEKDPELAQTWKTYVQDAIQNNKPISLDMIDKSGKFDIELFGPVEQKAAGYETAPVTDTSMAPLEAQAAAAQATDKEMADAKLTLDTLRKMYDDGDVDRDDVSTIHNNYIASHGADHPITKGVETFLQEISMPPGVQQGAGMADTVVTSTAREPVLEQQPSQEKTLWVEAPVIPQQTETTQKTGVLEKEGVLADTETGKVELIKQYLEKGMTAEEIIERYPQYKKYVEKAVEETGQTEKIEGGEDITDKIDKIKERHPHAGKFSDYEYPEGMDRKQVDNAQDDDIARELWGFKEISRNKYDWADYQFELEEIDAPPFKKGYVSHNYITLGKAPNGKWSFGLNVAVSISGIAYSPNIHDTVQYDTREAALQGAVNLFRERAKKFAADSKTATVEKELARLEKWLDSLEQGKEPETKKTQVAKVKEAIKEQPKSIKEIAKETGIVEPNIRRILGVGEKEGTFTRIERGVYILKVNGQDIAYIQTGDAVEVLPQLVEKGFKADMVFLDIPYKTQAVIGGNRGIRYDYITPAQFRIVVDSIAKIVRTDNAPVFYMFSQARSGEKDMQQYTDVMLSKFKPIARGEYTKLQKDGLTQVRNMRGEVIEPEGLILLTKSGEFDKATPNLNFKLVRPKGYQTEKPEGMLRSLIEESTEPGEVVLDPFAGSGVTIAAAVKTGRKGVGIEKKEEVVEKVIKPKVEKAARPRWNKESKFFEPEVFEAFEKAIADPSAENIGALIAQAKRFDEIEYDRSGKINKKGRGNIIRNTGYRLFKRALGENPFQKYPEWKILDAESATDFWKQTRLIPGVAKVETPVSENDFPSEKELDNPTMEVVDKAEEVANNNIQGIREELYEEGYNQSEITEIIKRLGEKHKDQIAGAEFEERLAAIKREIRQPEVTPYEPPPVSKSLEEKSNKEIVNDIKNVLLDEFKDIFGDERGSFSIKDLPPDKRESLYQKLKPLVMELIKRARAKYQARYNRDRAEAYVDGSVDTFDDNMRDAVMYATNRYLDKEGFVGQI